MQRNVAMWVTLGLATAGAICAVVTPSRGTLSAGYMAWHVGPYMLIAVLSILVPRAAAAWLGAAILMLIVDGWVLSEALLGTRSPLLMTFGLLATMKLLTVVPIGALLGEFARRLLKLA